MCKPKLKCSSTYLLFVRISVITISHSQSHILRTTFAQIFTCWLRDGCRSKTTPPFLGRGKRSDGEMLPGRKADKTSPVLDVLRANTSRPNQIISPNGLLCAGDDARLPKLNNSGCSAGPSGIGVSAGAAMEKHFRIRKHSYFRIFKC